MLKKWCDLPQFMQNDEVEKYYNALKTKQFSLFLKRFLDIALSLVLIVLLAIPMLIVAILIKLDSKGGVFFRQTRITQYGREFKIFKFRTMVQNAESLGSQVTVKNDMRITKVGSKIRKLRIDEIPQLFNVLVGDMSFVGTRPEVKKYTDKYTNEMTATFLMAAGITSTASIEFKDEDKILSGEDNVDEVYVTKVLPEKMKYNLCYIKNFSFIEDIKIMFRTLFAVLK
ncbi:MAG: sugar transferase [Oscillospiraceae bacterium]